MGQHTQLITDIFGILGWKVTAAYFETAGGERVEKVPGYQVTAATRLVLRVVRRWAPRCARCGAVCRGGAHERLPQRRWLDLPWAGRPVVLEADPIRVKCKRCRTHGVELLAWADPYQRETRRLQQHLALGAASAPVSHVAAQYGVGWSTVRSAEAAALARWDATRSPVPLRQVGVDEKWLGRRHGLEHHFVTIVSNLETGEPLWIGPGRGQDTLAAWLATLTPAEKAGIQLFAMDMHAPYKAAVRADPVLRDVPVVHDPFHVMKRVLETVTEVRREVFFRGGDAWRGIGRGSRWLVLRSWKHSSENQRQRLLELLVYNRALARAYQLAEEIRAVLHAPDRESLALGLQRVLRRTQSRRNGPLRKLHDSLINHREQLLNLGEHRPPTGRIEALNNNWETLVRRGRGYRDYPYLLLKLRFMVVNPIHSDDGTRRFLALGLQPPIPRAA